LRDERSRGPPRRHRRRRPGPARARPRRSRPRPAGRHRGLGRRPRGCLRLGLRPQALPRLARRRPRLQLAAMPGSRPAPAPVAVVTDSSAAATWPAGLPVVVVPLRVLAGGAVADDTAGPLPAPIAAELAGGERLSTARPAPERFAAAYAAAAAAGAPAVVSVHLSAELSGTLGSARLAAARAPI